MAHRKVIDITDLSEPEITAGHPMYPYLENKYFHNAHGEGHVSHVWGSNKLWVQWSIPSMNKAGVFIEPYSIATPDQVEKWLVTGVRDAANSPPVVKSCECGAHKVNSEAHSSWCGLYCS